MELKNFGVIDLETIEKYDPDLSSNLKFLLSNDRIHECWYVEYPVRIIVMVSFHKGKHVRIHDISKETGKADMINLIGESWSVVKEMMKVNKRGNKKKKAVETVVEEKFDIDLEEEGVTSFSNVVMFKPKDLLH